MPRLIALLALFLISPAVFGQYTNFSTGNSFNNPGSALIDSFIRSKMDQKFLLESFKKNGKSGSQPAKASSFDYSKSIFKGSGGRIFPEQVAKAAENLSDADRKQLAGSLEQAIDEFEKTPGVRNNLAYSITFMLGISLKITKNVEGSEEELEELAQAVSRKIEDHAEWSKMTDEQKQVVYETYLVHAAVMAALLQRGDQDSLRVAKEQANQCLNQFGITE